MDQVLFPQQCSGGGGATSVHIGRKIMWASYLCMIAVSLLLQKQTADAAPVLASSIGPYCQNISTLGKPNEPLNCCLPAPTRDAKRFVLPTNPTLRVRKPAHVLAKDADYVAKYNLAYARMRALEVGNPISYDTQWKTHCSFCNEAFLQRALPGPQGLDQGVPLQVHYSWLFLPWHRMLIYFHEKILGKLIDDPEFTLPFWNWDNQLDEGDEALANQIPSLFLPNFTVDGVPVDNSALRGDNRNTKHFPPLFLPLGYDFNLERLNIGQDKTRKQIADENLNIIYHQLVTKVSARSYLGGPYVLGADTSASTAPGFLGEIAGEPGGAENLHNVAHEWVGLIGDDAHPDDEDMGNFIFAGKDPIFYTHHSNVDRLWNVWKTLPADRSQPGGRKRQDFADPDFLDSEFTFYDENGDMVIVKVRDTLDTAKLGYTYSNTSASDNLWIQHVPKKIVPTAKFAAKAWDPNEYPEVDPSVNNTISDTPACFKVSRRAPNATDLVGKQVKHVSELTEEVVMEEIRIPHTCYVRFDAFIDHPSANEMTDFDESDYLGTFTHLPSGLVNTTSGLLRGVVQEERNFRIVSVRFDIKESLVRLGINDYTTAITVTIVPRMRFGKTSTLSFKSLRQDFQ